MSGEECDVEGNGCSVELVVWHVLVVAVGLGCSGRVRDLGLCGGHVDGGGAGESREDCEEQGRFSQDGWHEGVTLCDFWGLGIESEQGKCCA
jgi:hypothetical protein